MKNYIKKNKKPFKLCCKELTKASQYYYYPTIHVLKKDLITLTIGSLKKTSQKAEEDMNRLMQAMFPEERFSFKSHRSSKSLVYVLISVPIRFCPFCGKQVRKDLLAKWA